jgi:hypothetical protein
MPDIEVGDSTIMPENDSGVKQGSSYGYPGARGTGASVPNAEPSKGSPVNNKSAK